MNLSILPEDTCLQAWVKILSCTEIPISYQIAGGVSLLGALLKRQVWIDQRNWKVYPNQSVLFVGPSGIGKDTIINYVTREIERVGMPAILGGGTQEGVNARLANLGSPATAYIPAGELSSFFGQRDYQSGMIQSFTNLLSTGEKIDITTKGDLANKGQPKYIYQPTLTLHGGSTEEWLHKAMPDGTMEGGFLGRFLIVVENFGQKYIALVKQELSKKETLKLEEAQKIWEEQITEILGKYKKPCEMIPLENARHYYTNWYHNRFRYFSKTVLPYANRSRDMVLRLAMLMAISRKHWNWIDTEDMKFGATVLLEVGKYIDKILLPPTSEAQAARMILQLLPATSAELWKKLNQKFPVRILQAAETVLSASGQIYKEKGTNLWRPKPEV
jgi:energy-coupling factor transporter ATP-binding protein EcfA2